MQILNFVTQVLLIQSKSNKPKPIIKQPKIPKNDSLLYPVPIPPWEKIWD